MTLQQYDKTAYSALSHFDEYSYNCITHLMEEDEYIWKLLHYNDSEAWNKTNTTASQKRALIYSGQPDETLFRVFSDEGQPNAWTNEACILRIFPYAVFPENRTINTTTIVFDVYSHYRINHLSNYKTRVDTIIKRLVEVFNGSNIGGIGRLFFNALAAKENRIYDSGQIPFKGKRITMSTKQN